MAKVGIFSGTFDPVHSGHIAFCQAVLAAGNLDKVILLPEPEPREKTHVAPLAHRRAMLELAIKHDPRLQVVVLPGKRFSVAETLPQLQHRFAGDELSLLVGSDVVRTFAYRWPGLETLLAQMELLIALRSGDSQAELAGLLQAVQDGFPTITVRYKFVGAPHARAASSRIRAGALPMPELMAPVAAYIADHQLYVGLA